MPRSLVIWSSLLLALVLAIMPLPNFMQIGRPLWVLLVFTFWFLEAPKQVGLELAWCFGLAQDVLYGATLGEHGIIFVLALTFISLMRSQFQLAPMWRQSLALVIIYATVLLLQLWLNVLIERRPQSLTLLLPALISSLLWPWVRLGLSSLARWRMV
ncbi:hypothetical protein AKN88_09005 [Thiopseudomonas alkaliphila]|uniref:Rod shape-determining protein MreD n=1 Tax=Thiopseudomonas alkaliphila TaxID=1697053 RepID=A0A0K1XFA5_9GAMM|nr:rod shape-determining protein MreD [Thiopseudomonas alkaliphila]AKX60050.1 hypothetical protein AKN88_09005 [Thiopseudomonas alkaliphila]